MKKISLPKPRLRIKIPSLVRVFFLIVFLVTVATLVALPNSFTIPVHTGGAKLGSLQLPSVNRDLSLTKPPIQFSLFGQQFTNQLELKQGLDIQGGMQLVLQADMSKIAAVDRDNALESAKEIIQRRVDMYGVSEPVVQTVHSGEDYRILVDLAGVTDSSQAQQLVGTTAELEFKLLDASAAAQFTQKQKALQDLVAKDASSGGQLTPSQNNLLMKAYLDQFVSTGLTGKDLQKASVQFDPQTGQPVVSMQFNDAGRDKFGKITSQHIGEVLSIFLDGFPVTQPKINSAIYDGQAVITGQFTVDEAKQLSIQLNAGALPVPIQIIQQQTIGATLGQDSVQRSVQAGLIGLWLIILFMIVIYGWRGFIASVSLVIYAILTIAVYKIMGVTLSVPGIAGLLLTIGMAVDANILIFERTKEELRVGKSMTQAMELGFTRAWHSIKDANLTTIFIALVLINPLDFAFLNTSGLVRGFGLTLLIGVLLSLFTSMIVSRTLLKLFLKGLHD